VPLVPLVLLALLARQVLVLVPLGGADAPPRGTSTGGPGNPGKQYVDVKKCGIVTGGVNEFGKI
jgi:hypothetical protein